MKDAAEVLKQQGILLIEGFDKAARAWGLQLEVGEDARRVTNARALWLDSKKKLGEYVKALEGTREALLKVIAEHDERISEGTKHNAKLLVEVNQLQSDKRELNAALIEVRKQLRANPTDG